MHQRIAVVTLLVSIAVACTNDQLIRCVERQVDTNHDHMLSVDEMQNWIQKSHCFENVQNHINVEDIMKACDINKDGYIDRSDVLDRKSCLKTTGYHMAACRLCRLCAVAKNTKQ